jgi:hypothetical protein
MTGRLDLDRILFYYPDRVNERPKLIKRANI